VPDVNRGYEVSEFKPYKKAEEIDKKLKKLLDEHPITKDNLNLWTLYHRTVQSSLTILERQIEKVAKDVTT